MGKHDFTDGEVLMEVTAEVGGGSSFLSSLLIIKELHRSPVLLHGGVDIRTVLVTVDG